MLRTILLLSVLVSRAPAAEKPNFLFVFTDDQSFETIRALGNNEIKTPNLDRLVKRGTTFTHCYNQGGWHGAVCVASRTMLITGRYLWHAKNEEKKLRSDWVPQKKTWPQTLESAGYDTYFTGKWHVKAKADRVFKVARHVRGGMPRQTKAGYNRPIEGKEDKWKPWDKSFGGFWQGGKHWSEVVADDAVDYLAMAKKSKNPFFMYIAFNAPHDPRQSPKKFVDMYPLDKVAVPKPFIKDYPYQIGCNRIRDEVLAPFPRTEYAVKVNRQEYYAIITHTDQQIGRILDALEKSGKADNTYIIFTADHGLACGHHGLMGKQNMYDHSVRVPFIISGPKIPADRKIAAPIYLQDVVPTTLELAAIKKPKRVEFSSVLPHINGKSHPRDAVYGAYVDHQRMVTADGWKLIVYPKIKKMRLFHVKDDPLELTDLIAKPEHKERVAALQKKLRQLQQEVGDPLLKR